MEQPPKHRIDSAGVRVWTISSVITALVLYLIAVGLIFAVQYWEWPSWLPPVAFGLVTVIMIPSVFFFPRLRWRYYRYEVSEKEVYLQSGFFFQSRTLIPMVRVQYVETEEGPLLRPLRFGNAYHSYGGRGILYHSCIAKSGGASTASTATCMGEGG